VFGTVMSKSSIIDLPWVEFGSSSGAHCIVWHGNLNLGGHPAYKLYGIYKKNSPSADPVSLPVATVVEMPVYEDDSASHVTPSLLTADQ
jgi:hypothetical protein